MALFIYYIFITLAAVLNQQQSGKGKETYQQSGLTLGSLMFAFSIKFSHMRRIVIYKSP